MGVVAVRAPLVLERQGKETQGAPVRLVSGAALEAAVLRSAGMVLVATAEQVEQEHPVPFPARLWFVLEVEVVQAKARPEQEVAGVVEREQVSTLLLARLPVL